MRRIIEFLKNLGNWLARFFRWIIVEPKKVWITLLPIFVGVILCWLIPVGGFDGSILKDTLESRFRLTGLFLEILGIGTVVYGVIITLKLFNDGHLLYRFLLDIVIKWFKRFPKFRNNPCTVVSLASATATASSTGSIFGTSSLEPNSSLENRVTFLEEQLKQLHLQLYKNRMDFENEFKKLSDALNAESSIREAEDKQAQQALKEFAIGDTYLEFMGIFWLIMGAISATASTELAKFFG